MTQLPMPRWAHVPGDGYDADADYETLAQVKLLVLSAFRGYVPARHPALRSQAQAEPVVVWIIAHVLQEEAKQAAGGWIEGSCPGQHPREAAVEHRLRWRRRHAAQHGRGEPA